MSTATATARAAWSTAHNALGRTPSKEAIAHCQALAEAATAAENADRNETHR